MDWIDPRYAEDDDASEHSKGKSKERKKRVKSFSSQVGAALAQPLEVWSAAFGHALLRLKWAPDCSHEATWLWSTVIEEQARVLAKTGISTSKLAALVTDNTELDGLPLGGTNLLGDIGPADQSLETVAYQWLDTADSNASSALGLAALAWQLPELAQRANNQWLGQWFHDLVDRVAKYKSDDDDPVLCHLVLQCEIPLLLCMTTAGSKRIVQAEASRSMDNLAQLLECGEDNPYPWLVHGATYLRAALASVLRSRVLADGLGLRRLYPPQQRALASMMVHAARWTRSDGTALLGGSQAAPKSLAIWQAVAKQTRRPKSMLLALHQTGIKLGKPRETSEKKLNRKQMPEGSNYCEPAGCATMRSDWQQKGSRFAIDFSDSEVFIEALGPKGQPILAGDWGVQVIWDGQSEMKLGDWEEVCWFTDDEVDYLEIEATIGSHGKIQRQAILLREERLLFLGDAILSSQAGKCQLKSRLPLANGVLFEPAQKTREGILQLAGGQRCLTLPLHLPEWRRQLAPGKLECQDRHLCVTAETNSGRAYAPMLISLCNRHSKKPFTWRQLTVAEQLRIVPQDVAAAYRIQIGKEQWMIYRTLAAAARRTALGKHTFADFYCGRFNDSGDMETLVEVEASEETPKT